jgi:hypothetical protein
VKHPISEIVGAKPRLSTLLKAEAQNPSRAKSASAKGAKTQKGPKLRARGGSAAMLVFPAAQFPLFIANRIS